MWSETVLREEENPKEKVSVRAEFCWKEGLRQKNVLHERRTSRHALPGKE